MISSNPYLLPKALSPNTISILVWGLSSQHTFKPQQGHWEESRLCHILCLCEEQSPVLGSDRCRKTGFLPHQPNSKLSLFSPSENYSSEGNYRKLAAYLQTSIFNPRPDWSALTSEELEASFLSLCASQHGARGMCGYRALGMWLVW